MLSAFVFHSIIVATLGSPAYQCSSSTEAIDRNTDDTDASDLKRILLKMNKDIWYEPRFNTG